MKKANKQTSSFIIHILFLLVSTCFLFDCLRPVSAQSTTIKPWYIEPSIRYGRIIPTQQSNNYLWQIGLYSTEVRIGKQTTGKKEWEQWFRYPNYGVALRYSHYDRNWLGDKFAVFGFFNGYFVHRPQFSFFYQIGAGVNFWTKKYDFYTNPDNIFIGEYLCAQLDLCLGISARMSPHTDLVVRADFSHSSNGVLKLPNDGINSLSLSAGVRCRLYDQLKGLHSIDTIQAYKPINSLYFSISPALKQSRAEFSLSQIMKPHYCFASSVEIGYLRQPHPKFRYGGGFDLFYNSEILTRLKPEERSQDKCLMPALFATFDVTFSRMILHTSFGAYVGRYYDFYKPYYEHLGVQFLLGPKKNHIVGASIKAHFGRADYIEWTYGYQFYNWYDKKSKKIKTKRFLKSNL